jgi:hypothetical protein
MIMDTPNLEQRVEELEAFCFSPEDSMGAAVVSLIDALHATCVAIGDTFHDVGHSMHKCMHHMGAVAEALRGESDSDHPSFTPPEGEGATIHPFPDASL